MKKEKRVVKDAKVLTAFIQVYCRENHGGGAELCEDCRGVLEYALRRNEKCPLDPKPKCKDCKIHCYKPEMREKIRRIMKFSGIWYIKRGRLDWVWHYFF
ncbi:nitrous oxide-stimulated promoter family protein [Seleniivibrio woodruffii]|uniref:nitrous oxide-stimulated promoter family protein n=1 Tax=Seleniivibrio woodruffii TaxID=1078050 RepID=UPI00240A7509|nr:nitrous oxide-stimulated promoter family protein [Seleniivibrio woodruffii]